MTFRVNASQEVKVRFCKEVKNEDGSTRLIRGRANLGVRLYLDDAVVVVGNDGKDYWGSPTEVFWSKKTGKITVTHRNVQATDRVGLAFLPNGAPVWEIRIKDKPVSICDFRKEYGAKFVAMVLEALQQEGVNLGQ